MGWETPRVGKGEILHNKVAPRSRGFGNLGRWQPVVFGGHQWQWLWSEDNTGVREQEVKDSTGFVFYVAGRSCLTD